ncbi:hypothetical protein [Streptomyces sp. NPDC057694]|uniref:hypothetical protein n=1 Tax=unclassified Streptomyces TaxID=2593676 RepID=UPI0036B0D1C0
MNAIAMALSDVNETLTAVGGFTAGAASLIVAWVSVRDKRRTRNDDSPPPPPGSDTNASPAGTDSSTDRPPDGPTP